MELKDLLSNPNTVPFSRTKYIPGNASDEKIAEFINGLSLKTTETKYKDDWEEFGIGLQFEGIQFPEPQGMPWATLEKPLSQSRVGLVTTGGVFVEGQTPFERGDFSSREISRDISKEDLRIFHPGYDHGSAEADINCIFPLDRFKELEQEKVIGELAQTHYSFMGLINQPEGLINETAPDVGRYFKEAGVDLVFLAST